MRNMRSHVTYTLTYTFLFHSCVSHVRTLHASARSPLGFLYGVCQFATMGFFTQVKGSAQNVCTFFKVHWHFYSRSHKTVNTRENFWNVYYFATNQMRDETAKDNRQTTAGISHDLINLQFSLCLSLKKLFFDHKPTLVTWFCLFKNQTTE